MNRDQMIAHLSLLGWEPRMYFRSPPTEFRLVNLLLGHNVTEWTGDIDNTNYHRGWGSVQVEHLWPTAEWDAIPDKKLREMFAAVEAENGS